VKVTALAAHTPEAVRAALAARGWDTQPAWFAATGVQALVVLLEEITAAEREGLVRWAAKAGADVLTGEGWALVSAAVSRLAPLARPDRLPPGLEGLAPELGRFLASYADPPRRWEIGGGGSAVNLDHPVLIGIVNVTPDSFSDGGRFATVDRAVAQAERLVGDGCELLDVGGESTRPGAAPVSDADEIARVAPVIEQLARRGLGPVSVDTRKAAVARAALAAGAAVVNDVSGLAFDAALAGVVGDARAGMIVMHMRGTPDTMDSLAVYRHVAADVAAELGAAVGRAEAGGVARERIVVDPGFGFAKTSEQNFRLLDELATVVGLGYPVAVGPSRKRFLGAATGRPVDDRDRATAVACALAWERGARLFRVHDAALAREALRVAGATTSPVLTRVDEHREREAPLGWNGTSTR
jgi:dihydropteroate synthase